jgi:hypothetical protein
MPPEEHAPDSTNFGPRHIVPIIFFPPTQDKFSISTEVAHPKPAPEVKEESSKSDPKDSSAPESAPSSEPLEEVSQIPMTQEPPFIVPPAPPVLGLAVKDNMPPRENEPSMPAG